MKCFSNDIKFKKYLVRFLIIYQVILFQELLTTLDLLSWVCFSIFIFYLSKIWHRDQKIQPHKFEHYRPKNENFLWFPGFHFELIYPKTNTWKSQKFCKNTLIMKYESLAAKTFEITKWHQNSQWFWPSKLSNLK